MVDPYKPGVDKFAYQDNVDILQSRGTIIRKWCEDIGGSFSTIENENEMVVVECRKKGNQLVFEGQVHEDEGHHAGVSRSTEVIVNGETIDGRIDKDGPILEVGDWDVGPDVELNMRV